MDISVVIVSYNVKEYIVSCVESIYKHSKSNYTFEIIIVDNNSKDGSAEELIKEFPKIQPQETQDTSIITGLGKGSGPIF